MTVNITLNQPKRAAVTDFFKEVFPEGIAAVHCHVLEYFDKKYGNTYQSVSVQICYTDNGKGKILPVSHSCEEAIHGEEFYRLVGEVLVRHRLIELPDDAKFTSHWTRETLPFQFLVTHQKVTKRRDLGRWNVG